MRSPLTSIALGLGMLAVSCLPGGKLPLAPTTPSFPPPSHGTSALHPITETAAPDEGPLKVAFSSPEGEEVEVPLPTIVFSRTMHRLGAAPDDPPVTATIHPPVEGHWRWIGSRALQFSPNTTFPRATRFHIQVAPGLPSLDGQVIDSPISLEFTTPRLKLTSIDLGRESTSTLYVSFNQKVDPNLFVKAFSIVDEYGTRLPFQIKYPNTPTTFFALLPKTRWPIDTTIKATLAPISGIEGNLGISEPQQFTLRERQLTEVTELSCSSEESEGVCSSYSEIKVWLNEELPPTLFQSLVQISPSIPFKLTNLDKKKNKPSRYFRISADFKLNTEYQVTITPSGKRRRGEPGLDKGASYKFYKVPSGPTISLLLHGTYFYPNWTKDLFATFSDISSVEISSKSLSLKEILAYTKGERKHLFSNQNKKQISITEEEKDWATIPFAEIIPEKPGPLWLSASGSNGARQISTDSLIQRTDLSLSSRISPERSVVWVTRLSTGFPIANAEVEIYDMYDHKIEGKTDLQGVAVLNLGDLPPPPPRDSNSDRLLLVARSGEDWIYQEIDRPSVAEMEGVLFTDRDIYRPGEIVYIKGVARLPSTSGPLPQEGHEVSLSIQLPDQPPLILIKKLSSWGTFSHEITLPPDIPPRGFTISLLHREQKLSTVRLNIRHVREASFKVSTNLDKSHYLPEDSFICTGGASYLYGGSMANLPYSLSILTKPSSFSIPGLSDFSTGIPYNYRETFQRIRSYTSNESRNLSAQGSFKSEGKILPITYTQKLTCSASVSDPGQQTVENSAYAWVHPAEFYIALKDLSWNEAEAGKDLKIQALAVEPNGKRRSEKVTLELFEARYDQKKNTQNLIKITSCTVNTGSEIVSCPLPIPKRYGVDYRIIANAKDSKSREVRTLLTFRINDKPRQQLDISPDPPKKQKPTLLSLDKLIYHPGDTAKIAIHPTLPFNRGLLTIEREGVFLQKVFSAIEDPIEFPISPWMAPKSLARVIFQHAISTETPYEEHKPTEQYELSIPVKRPSRLLSLRIQPSQTEASPGDEITVDVDVNDDKGKPASAEVTLYAVNEGMLQLSGYQPPNLEEKLPLTGEFLVTAHDTQKDLGWLEKPVRYGPFSLGPISGSGYGFGSGVGYGSTTATTSTIRSDFRPTPMFLPTLVTDTQGHVRASFKLPDSLTAYRIMAVAISKDDRYGNAESSITARLNAQIRPMIPQMVRAGDTFQAAAVAANNSEKAIDVKVSLDAKGFYQTNSQPEQFRLEAGESRRVTFPLEAKQIGQGTLLFRLTSSDGTQDAAEVPLEAQSPLSLEASALYGKTIHSTLESIADLSTIRSDTGGVELMVSSSPISGLAPGLEQLVEYPYGCTEQLTSRLVPLVTLRTLAKSLSVALPDDTEEASKKAVESLLKNRHEDGRFGLWQSSSPSVWLTAYAYWGLAEARRNGIEINSELFRTAAIHLAEAGSQWMNGKRKAAEASFALDVLVDLPEVDNTMRSHALILLRQMTDHLADFPVFARFQVLHALARLGVSREELAPLIKNLEATLHLDGAVARIIEPNEWFPELLDSRIRSSAMALRALLEAAPQHPMLEPLARGLITDRGPKGWRSTQETAWALLALDAYRRAQGGENTELKARVMVGTHTLLEASLKGLIAEQRAWVPMSDLVKMGSSNLLFQAQGTGKLFYQARLRYALVQPPSTNVFAGIEVNRTCSPLDETRKNSDPNTFYVGQWVACQIEVSTPSPRHYTLLNAPIPGGFELADPSLQGTPQHVKDWSYDFSTHKELRKDGAVYFNDDLSGGVHSWSFVAKAMTAGKYFVPPTRMEEMYSPETYGQTTATIVTILP